MIKTVLLVFFATFIGCALGQQWLNVPTNDPSRLYMAQIRGQNTTGTWIRCTGVFIRDNHVLTAATCVQDVTAANLLIFSGSADVFLNSSATLHRGVAVTTHPNFLSSLPLLNNLAVIEVDTAITRPTPLQPRWLSAMVQNRFCSILGWQGFHRITDEETIHLRMHSVPIANSTTCGIPGGSATWPQAYCTSHIGTESVNDVCGGLIGAPVFCTGSDDVSGIVVRDNFCRERTGAIGGSFISVDPFHGWINEVSSSTSVAASIGILLVSLFLSIKMSF